MKHTILSTALFTLCLFSCSESRTDGDDYNVDTKCYISVIREDSTLLQISVNDNKVEGMLRYNFLEKDDNDGSITGIMQGDTIFLDYTFESEGATSVRETAFLYDNDAYLPGYGPMEDENGKLVFKNRNEIRFDTEHPFEETDCP